MFLYNFVPYTLFFGISIAIHTLSAACSVENAFLQDVYDNGFLQIIVSPANIRKTIFGLETFLHRQMITLSALSKTTYESDNKKLQEQLEKLLKKDIKKKKNDCDSAKLLLDTLKNINLDEYIPGDENMPLVKCNVPIKALFSNGIERNNVLQDLYNRKAYDLLPKIDCALKHRSNFVSNFINMRHLLNKSVGILPSDIIKKLTGLVIPAEAIITRDYGSPSYVQHLPHAVSHCTVIALIKYNGHSSELVDELSPLIVPTINTPSMRAQSPVGLMWSNIAESQWEGPIESLKEYFDKTKQCYFYSFSKVKHFDHGSTLFAYIEETEEKKGKVLNVKHIPHTGLKYLVSESTIDIDTVEIKPMKALDSLVYREIKEDVNLLTMNPTQQYIVYQAKDNASQKNTLYKIECTKDAIPKIITQATDFKKVLFLKPNTALALSQAGHLYIGYLKCTGYLKNEHNMTFVPQKHSILFKDVAVEYNPEHNYTLVALYSTDQKLYVAEPFEKRGSKNNIILYKQDNYRSKLIKMYIHNLKLVLYYRDGGNYLHYDRVTPIFE